MKEKIVSMLDSLIQLTKGFKVDWKCDDDEKVYTAFTERYMYMLRTYTSIIDKGAVELMVRHRKKPVANTSRFTSSVYPKVVELNTVVYDFAHNGKYRYDVARLTNKVVHDEQSTKKHLYTEDETNEFLKDLVECLYENHSEDKWISCDNTKTHFIYESDINGGNISLMKRNEHLVTLIVYDDDGRIEIRDASNPLVRTLYNKVSLLTSNEIDVYDIICDLSDLYQKEPI